MKFRLALAVAFLLFVGACAQLNAALGRGERGAAQQAPEHSTDPALAGLSMVEGGYARFERDSWGCDYKCYNFPGRWLADRETPVYADPRINAPVMDHLAIGEWVNAVRYEEHIQPRRAVVTRAGGGLEVGEVIYELWSYDEEDFRSVTFWRRGRTIDLLDSDADQPEVLYETELGGSIDWVYVEREGGRRNGWLRDPMMPGVENRIDECPAFDVSAPCRDIRSRAGAPQQVSHPPSQPFRDCADCPLMVWIPGQSFAVSQYEITIAQWNACILDHGCPSDGSPLEGDGRHPVAGMSRYADVYFAWLSEKTGHRYRWLTLEEWSLAAFPGGRRQNYYWGNDAPVCDPGARNGVAYDLCRSDGAFPVGSFQPNAYGLYDVLGNVSELVIAGSESMGFVGGSWRSPETELGGSVEEFSQGDYDARGLRVARDR